MSVPYEFGRGISQAEQTLETNLLKWQDKVSQLCQKEEHIEPLTVLDGDLFKLLLVEAQELLYVI
jgi:hypothetical protein